MNTLFTGQNFIRLGVTSSTQEYCENLLAVGQPPEGTVVLAEEQTGGKGMSGNTWYSEPGHNLLFSIIFYPTFISPSDAFVLNKICSLALYNALLPHTTGHELRIKWPNDILLNRKKIAGILLRNQVSGTMIRSTTAGIGLNVNQVHFPPKLYRKASSLRSETGIFFDRNILLESVLIAWDA